jgi:hypothetical protein
MDSLVDMVKTSEEVILFVDNISEPYIQKENIILVAGKKFVQTTTVPPITNEGRNLL